MTTLRRRTAVLAVALALFATLFSACSDDGGSIDITIEGGDETTRVETAGFFSGLWDGFISPFTGIASLFDDVEVYDDEAAGAYPLGFGLGLFFIIVLLSGMIAGPRYVRRRRY